MEFPFNINELLPDSITVVDEKLAPFRNKVKFDRLVGALVNFIFTFVQLQEFTCITITRKYIEIHLSKV